MREHWPMYLIALIALMLLVLCTWALGGWQGVVCVALGIGVGVGFVDSR